MGKKKFVPEENRTIALCNQKRDPYDFQINEGPEVSVGDEEIIDCVTILEKNYDGPGFEASKEFLPED